MKGVLWLMVSTTEGLTEIRAWDVSVGQAPKTLRQSFI